jgi:4-cresol dehydrogenase (hydroxylating)
VSLPPAMLKTLTDLLSPANVVWAPADVEERTRSCLPQSEIPEGVVYPRTVEEVRAVLATAREHGVPVWPISTGKNWGYGEKAAPYAGG